LENPTDQKNTPIFFRDIWEKKVEFGLPTSITMTQEQQFLLQVLHVLQSLLEVLSLGM